MSPEVKKGTYDHQGWYFSQMPSYLFSSFHVSIFQILCVFDSNYQHLRLSLEASPGAIGNGFPVTCRELEVLGVPLFWLVIGRCVGM